MKFLYKCGKIQIIVIRRKKFMAEIYLTQDEEKDVAVLIGLDTDDGEAEISLDELERLCDTAGIEVAAKALQRREKQEAATYIGRGKAEEIAEFVKNNGVNLAIADDELKGSQVRELEEILDCRVIDRTTLILDIFAQRARSTEGKLQVELAQLKYRLPRLQGMGKALSRLGGGIGTRGPGETKLETDKRHIQRRITHIEQELAEVEKRREQNRRRREKEGTPTAALVGYTNAGKSSLMNALCDGADVYVMNQLFATLDPTVRKLKTDDNREVLLVDTVGFIRKLPTALVKAFRSTLEESIYADVLLLVVDYSDPEAESQIRVVRKILADLGAESKPSFIVFNKNDLIPRNRTVVIPPDLFTDEVCWVSAKTGEGLDDLRQKLLDRLVPSKKYTLLVPYSDAGVISELHDRHGVISEEYVQEGIKVKVVLGKDAQKYEKYAI